MSENNVSFIRKIKPLYLYGVIILLALTVLFFFAKPSGEKKIQQVTKDMPQDDIHKGMQDPLSKPPGKDNVSEQTRHMLDQMKKAVDANPDDTVKIREYADFLLAAHKPDDALIQYQNILKKDPKRADILFSIAFVHYSVQDYDKSEDYIRRGLTFDKDNLDAIYNLGAILATKGDKAGAEKVWNDLIKKYPNSQTATLAKESIEQLKKMN